MEVVKRSQAKPQSVCHGNRKMCAVQGNGCNLQNKKIEMNHVVDKF